MIFCLAGMTWYMQRLGRHGVVYGIVRRVWHGIWYVLAGMACIWYCLTRYGFAYGVAWHDDMYMV